MNAQEILTRAARRKCIASEDNRDCPCGGSGLWLPELTEPCIHCNGCESCPDEGRTLFLDDRDRLDAAAERLGYPLHVGGKLDSGYTYAHGRTLSDPLLQVRQIHESYRIAQQVALARAIKHVWPEVEDEC